MLLLTRNLQEKVYIYDKQGRLIVTVTLCKILDGPRAQLGFDAPLEFSILRADAKRRA